MKLGAYELDSINHCDLLTLCDGLPDASVDMILADLPYGTTACSWDTVIPFAPMWERFKRVIKPRGAIVLTASQPFTSALVMSNVEMFRYEWVWRKSSPSRFQNAQFMPMLAHESIVAFFATVANYYPQMRHRTVHGRRTQGRDIGAYGGLKRTFSQQSIEDDDGLPISVLEFNSTNHAGEITVHPTQKPVALFEYLIRTYTREGELVLDPTCGSGTTALAARNAKRHWLCGDSDAHYCDVARDRLRLPFEARTVKASDDLSHLPLFAVNETEVTV